MTIAYDVPPAAPAPLIAAARDEFPGDRCPGSGCPDNAQPEAKDDRGSGRIVEFRSYDAQYSQDEAVGYISGMAVAAGPGEVWRAEALALMAMPEGAKLEGWWPTAINQSILAGLV